MPKPRSIDPSFWDDPDIATLSRDERLLLIGMITSCADDEGRLLADAGYLRKRVFGYDDDVSRQDVQGWRDNVVRKCRNVRMYEAQGQAYMCFLNWREYQPMRYVIASKLPAYTENGEELLSNKEDYGKLPQSSVNSLSVGLSSVNVVLGSEEAQSAPTPPIEKNRPTTKPARKTLAAHPIPPDFGITADMRQWAKERGVLQFIDLERITARFIAYWTEGEGQGRQKKNWLLTWKNWVEDEAGKAEARGVRYGGNGNGVNQGYRATGSAAIQASSSGPNQSRAGLGKLPLAANTPRTKAG